MRHTSNAKLAAKVILLIAMMPLAAAAHAGGTLAEPVKIRFQLADGIRVSGDLTMWDREGFDGTFGRREWNALRPDDVWTVHQRVMSPNSATDWTDLGRALLLMTHDQKKAGELAERAFSRAIRIDPAAAAAVQLAREEAQQAAQKRREAEQAANAAKLSTISPEGEPWPADAWPPLTAQEQTNAALTMRAEAQKILEQANLSFAPVETDHILLFTDLPRSSAVRWAMLLEKAYDLTRTLLINRGGADPGHATSNLFWGKLVVFVFKEQDRFRLVEADAFRHLVPQATVAVCHPAGPKAFINAFKDPDEDLFQWSLVHEFVHAYLHRYRTPARLPAWANEGFAEAVCARLLKDNSIGKERRKQALEYLRNPTVDLAGLLDLKYVDGSWPGPKGIGTPIGGLLVELMMQEQPQRWLDWLNAIKKGKEWPQSLADEFGATRAKLAEIALQYYKVND